METHVKMVGVLFIVFGVLGILVGLFFFWMMAGIGVVSGGEEAFAVLPGIGTILGGIVAILSILEIIVGIFLLKRHEWARIAGIVLAILGLIEIPLGTIFGIYSL